MRNTQIRVLLIEDDPDDARFIREMLIEGGQGQSNFIINAFATLHNGISEARTTQVDVILLDLNLPDSTGMDTLFVLSEQLPDIPIIVLTGSEEAMQFGVEAVQSGAQDYLLKNEVDSKLLRQSIRYAIERHEIEQRLRRSEQEYRSLIEDVFDTSSVAVIILDSDFHAVWCNEATETYFGVKRENLIGHDKRVVISERIKHIFADPDDFEMRLLRAYAENSFTRNFECHVLLSEDLAERWLHHWSQPIRDGIYKGGRIEQYTDITERKLLEITEREQREFAEALREIAMTLTSTLDFQKVLDYILSNLKRIVPHDTASLTLVADGHLRLTQKNRTGMLDTQDISADHDSQIEYQPYRDRMAATGQGLIISDMREDSEVWKTGAQANMRAYMGAPIMLREEAIGFISLLNQAPDSFPPGGLDRLNLFAGLAAIAIQNAQLYRQSRQLSATEERQRLARDLHDSVSQTIFTCRAMLEAAVKHFDANPARARELVEEVYQLVIVALSELRVLLLELRPGTLTEIGLKELFQQYLVQPIQDRQRFALEVSLDDIPALPGKVQIALYRIAQEALNNVAKHAEAENVSLQVLQYDDCIELEICDDGTGFIQDKTEAISLGLRIMRERAEEISATLRIESSLGNGTCIGVIWKQQGENS